MLIHNVYFWLKDDVSEAQALEFYQGITDLISAVDEIERGEIGRPAKTPSREVVDHSFYYSMFVWFNTIEDHNVYQDHPAHHEFIDKFKHLWEKVHVRDSEIK